MELENRHLSRREIQVLRLMLEKTILPTMAKTLEMTAQRVLFYLRKLKKKGFRFSTDNQINECKAYLEKYGEPRKAGITVHQVDLLKRFSQGLGYEQIAKDMGLATVTVRESVERSCRILAIGCSIPGVSKWLEENPGLVLAKSPLKIEGVPPRHFKLDGPPWPYYVYGLFVDGECQLVGSCASMAKREQSHRRHWPQNTVMRVLHTVYSRGEALALEQREIAALRKARTAPKVENTMQDPAFL